MSKEFTTTFEKEVFQNIESLFTETSILFEGTFPIVQLNNSLFIQLISLNKVSLTLPSTYFEKQSNEYHQREQQITHLWEDHWRNHKEVIISRLSSFAGITKKIHGRKTKVIRIDQAEYYQFLTKNHLQGPVSTKYKFGLYQKEDLVAVAGFSHPRKISRGENISKSSELVRFCNLINNTVIGGLDKFIKHFSSNFEIDDIMSYADRDWSNGKSYQRLGFDFIQQTSPTTFWVDPTTNKRYFEHILSNELNLQEEELHDHLKEKGFIRIFNSGNLKFIKEV